MTAALRAALQRLINAGSYGAMADAYRSLQNERLTFREREIAADLFNALVHHRAMTEDAA
jgi:hypothetical protein